MAPRSLLVATLLLPFSLAAQAEPAFSPQTDTFAQASQPDASLIAALPEAQAPVLNVTAPGGIAITAPPSSVTPEPSTFLLLGTGLMGMAGAIRRRRQRL